MRPIALELRNCRTYERFDWEIPQGQAVAIVSPNGGGKSTICNAIDAALFGAEGRSLADWLSRDRPEQTMSIGLVFQHGQDLYRIDRHYSGKGRGTTRVDFNQSVDGGWMPLNRESGSATQEAIEEIIGLDRASFRASAFMAQGDGGVFCEAQPRERKQILASVLGLQVWDGYRDRARTDLRAAEQSLAVVRAKIEQADVELAERPGLVLLAAQAKERETATRTALEECGAQLAKARERLSALREAAGLREAAERAARAARDAKASLLERIASLEWQIEEANERLAEREALQVLAEGLPGLEAERDRLAEQAQGFAERQRLTSERTRLFDEVADLIARAEGLAAKSLAVAENTEAEVCDLCQRPLDRASARAVVASYGEQATAMGEKSTEIARQADALTPQIQALPAEAPDPERVRHATDLIRLGLDAQQKLAALAEVEARRDAAQDELQKVRAGLPELEQRVSAARSELEKLGSHDPREEAFMARGVDLYEVEIADQRQKLDAILQETAGLDAKIERLVLLETQTADAKNKAATLQNEVELLSHMERACGPNGVPALILETSAIPQLEAEWNRLLRLLPTDSGDLFEVELHTQREKKSGEGAVDALDVIVYANGTARPYSTYSGGERMRIDIAQRRALSNLLAHRKGAECPLMILDEPNSLDDQGMAALAQVLEDLAVAEGLTILVVSHDPALRDAFENSIQIVKEDGRSRIVGTAEPSPIMQEVR